MEQPWEVRTSITDGIARVMFKVVSTRVVVLHGSVEAIEQCSLNESRLARKMGASRAATTAAAALGKGPSFDLA